MTLLMVGPRAQGGLWRADRSVVVGLVALVAMVGAACLFVDRWGWLGVGVIGVFASSVVAAIVDVRVGRLPNRLVGSAAGAAVVVCVAELIGGHAVSAASVLAGGVILGAPLIVLHLVSPAALGFGDVKLGVVLGCGVGIVDPRLAVLALLWASGGTVVAAALMRRATMPFGPGLVLGAAAALLLARPIAWEIAIW